MRIESSMYLYNDPVMNVAGKITFSNTAVTGAGTISAGGGLEILFPGVSLDNGVSSQRRRPADGQWRIEYGWRGRSCHCRTCPNQFV